MTEPSWPQAFSYGFALALMLGGAFRIGYDHAFRHAMKLERHHVKLHDWHADTGERVEAVPVETAAGKVRRF